MYTIDRQRRHALVSGVAVMLMLIAGLLSTPPVNAAPQQPASLGAPHIQRKVILSDTSISTPAFWTNNPAQDAAAISPASVLAWTGTDAAHHLNLMTSSDGLNYGNKRILAETSPAAPAVTVTSSGAVAIAWIGTDPHHSLNILLNAYSSSPQKLILVDNSFTGPALVSRNGALLLAWAGTDSGHMLNLRPISLSGGLHAGPKVILSAYHSVSAPSLTVDPRNNGLLLSWPVASPVNRIQIATSSNGTSWQTPASPLAEWTPPPRAQWASRLAVFQHISLAGLGLTPPGRSTYSILRASRSGLKTMRMAS